MSRKLCKLYIPRLMALLLCLVLLLNAVPVAYAAGGCGSNLSWDFDGTTLTISGSGAMSNYTHGTAPWYGHRGEILQIVLSEGITDIGDWAFADCAAVSHINLPGSVQTIGEAAFYGCTGMTMLGLNNGLRIIGESAFSQCENLADLRLPETVIEIDHHAFYLCKSLGYVRIPASLLTIGSGVFAYCANLVRVDVEAAISMPGWSFYGCDKLQSVTVAGGSVSPDSLKIPNIPGGDAAPTPPPAPMIPSAAPDIVTESASTVTNDGNTATENKTTVQKTENATTVTNKTTQEDAIKSTTEITSTVQNDAGWQEVLEDVGEALPLQQNNEPFRVTVYSPNGDQVGKDVLQALAGKNVELTVQTQSGAQFRVDCKKIPDSVKKDLELSYTLIPAIDVPEALAGYTVYRLRFDQSTNVPTEMIIQIPGENSFRSASLYREAKSEPELLQSVLVDSNGRAHFYLGSIDQKTEYLIGMDIPNAIEDSPIIPAELHDVYKVANVFEGKEYVVTGRTSSWNMGLGKVMTILAVVMVSVIVLVGFIMYLWNKQRLKNGYQPDWDDEE